MRALLILTLLTSTTTLLISCQDDVPGPRLICHNANCVEPATPAEDDTVDALTASLALMDAQGTPLVDGVEIDTFWFGEESRCLFAHDLGDLDSAEDVDIATQILATHLEARAKAGLALTRSPGPFSIFIELKGHVGVSKTEKHDAAQLDSHAACAATVGLELAEHARTHDYDLELVYTSFDASLLAALDGQPQYTMIEASTSTITKLGYLQGVPAPLDSQSKPFDSIPEGLKIDMLDAHPHWTRHSTLEAAESMGWELALWMFSVVPETYDAIDRYQPHYVTTSEARALSGWLDERGK